MRLAEPALSSKPAAACRRVLITGVSKGRGRALALEMAERGAIVIGCARSQDKLNSLRHDIASASVRSIANKHILMNVDVKSNNWVADFASDLAGRDTFPDIIVNNAGIISKTKRMWEISAEEFDDIINTNVKGTANILRHFIPIMIEREHGVIVNFSHAGKKIADLVAPYHASSSAVMGLTMAVARELPPGVAIVALDPGLVHTERLEVCIGSSAQQHETLEDWAERMAGTILKL